MTEEMPVPLRLLVLGLALLVAVHAAISYPAGLVVEVAASTVLLVAGGCWLFSRRVRKDMSAISVFTLVLSAAITIQVIVAHEIHGPLRAVDRTPGYALFVRLWHYLVVVAVVLAGRERTHLAGLGAAVVYTSVFYTPTFATPEAAPPFVPLTALAIVLLATAPSVQLAVRDTIHISLLKPLSLFVLLVLVSSLFSRAPHESTTFLFKLLSLLGLALAVPLFVQTRARWKHVMLFIVAVSVAVPVLLSAAKLAQLTAQLGTLPAIQYRMRLNELGRANLLSRSLTVGAPLLIALAKTTPDRKPRSLWWGLVASALIVFLACRSWTGWIGAGIACAFAASLGFGRRWLARWRAHRRNIGWYLLHVAVLFAVGLGLLGLWRLAPRLNARSFNGRLFQFRATINEIVAHPLLGVGPGHYYSKSKYTTGLDWSVNTRTTLDDPLLPVEWLRDSSRLHTHDLFLDIAAGMGLPGLAAFVWFLFALFRFGLKMRMQLSDQDRVLLTGCLVGIVASLGWGLIDVMEVSSPFFTFPTWALIGLLLAAPRAFSRDAECPIPAASLAPDSSSAPRLFQVLCLGLAFVAVIMPLCGNLCYRAGYIAYQERRWADAVSNLDWATRWEPLAAKYHGLRGEALINLARYDEAILAYERAVSLRRDFAPYHAQLGWLYWLQGDLGQATAHFQKAVEMDPREAWRDGLHADLGLAYAAQGRVEEAVPLFRRTIELDPQMAQASYWVWVQGADGGLDVVLDPVYTDATLASDLRPRILAHLGQVDYGPRHFAYNGGADSVLSLTRVLDGIEADYMAARAADSDKVLRLMATAAEAARFAGLRARAERTLLLAQQAYPHSAYGFRGLGALYHEQARLEQARPMLERAVEVSARDPDSWCELVEVYLDQERWEEAARSLDGMYWLMPLDSRLYTLRARFHTERRDLIQAADALRRSLAIEESVSARLTLSDLYWRSGQEQLVKEQCIQTAEVLFRAWPQPLAPELWEIGGCLARADDEDPAAGVSELVRERPLIGDVLIGHIYRARGLQDHALAAYQRAAESRPDEGAVRYLLGEVYQEMGQSELAEAEYRQAARLDPLESLPLLALGRQKWAEGQREAALESFRAATEATPGWGQAHTVLGNALLATGDPGSAAGRYQLAQVAGGGVREGVLYDFAAHLAEATTGLPDLDYVRNDYFTIDGDQRRVLFAHPDARITYTVAVAEDAVLAFNVATAPGSWDRPGDGVTFSVYVESDRGPWRAFSEYIDPKRDPSDRRWHSREIDLGGYAGQAVNIIFETDGGPAGDCRYDWAGWGEPRLVRP
jgi:tetratricopeptide (TPR) repeat protein/O-antigen ligase